MELRVLKYFLMVAREENITRAAQRLNVTQPTLSRQLMQMEEELGVKLFKRGKHSISLTEVICRFHFDHLIFLYCCTLFLNKMFLYLLNTEFHLFVCIYH